MYRHEFEALLKSDDIEGLKNELRRRVDIIGELQDKLRVFEYNEIKIDKDGYFDFGCANGWKGFTPAQLIIKRCREAKHETDRNSGAHCLGSVVCNVCKYHYWYDSSD